MNHAIDPAERLLHLRQHLGHAAFVRHVRTENKHVAAGLFQGLYTTDFMGNQIVLGLVCQVGRPLVVRGQRRAAGQHDPGIPHTRQIVGNDQPDAPQTAGDQIYATMLEADLRRLRCRKRHGIEALHIAPRGAISHVDIELSAEQLFR